MLVPGRPDATALLVRDGRVAWVGDEDGADSLEQSAHAVTDRVDLAGGLLTPAFVDAHVHLVATGLTAGTGVGVADLRPTRSAAQLLDAVAAIARALPAGRTVLGFGWDDSTWQHPGELPTRAQLDRAAGGRPVFLGRVDVHSALVTGAPAGGDQHTGDQHGGDDPRDQDGGEATARWEAGPDGLTLPRVMAGLVTRDARRALVEAALDAAAARGIASVHEMAAPQLAELDDLALVDELGCLLRPGDDDLGPASGGPPGDRATGNGATGNGAAGNGAAGDGAAGDGAAGNGATARPLVAAWWGEHASAGGLAAGVAAGATGCGGDLCVDGSFGSRTAALLAPYADAPHAGAVHLDADAVADHVVACARAGVSTGFHLIGDRAAETVAAGLALAAAIVGVPAVAATAPRLEHAEMIPRHLLEPLAVLGAVASVQPAFAATWAGPGRMYERRLGRARADGTNRLADMAAAGLPLATGSDAPVTPLAGWSAVRDAVANPVAGQGLSPRAAFAAATRGGWRVARRTGVGQLTPGAPAHLAWWDVTGGWDESRSDGGVQRWSTDPSAGVVPLPAVGTDVPLPRCRGLLVAGRRATSGPAS